MNKKLLIELDDSERTLASLRFALGEVNSSIEEISSGIDAKIYVAAENEAGLISLRSNCASLESLIAMIVERQAATSMTTVREVQHWESERRDGTSLFAFEVDDQRDRGGRLSVAVAPKSGEVNDIMGISVEVGTLPGADTHTQVAHVHFDGDNLAVSIFKMGGKYLLRPEQGVTVKSHRVEVCNSFEFMWLIE